MVISKYRDDADKQNSICKSFNDIESTVLLPVITLVKLREIETKILVKFKSLGTLVGLIQIGYNEIILLG